MVDMTLAYWCLLFPFRAMYGTRPDAVLWISVDQFYEDALFGFASDEFYDNF
jgi:hypothetical protein